jgi:hypothetical protein
MTNWLTCDNAKRPERIPPIHERTKRPEPPSRGEAAGPVRGLPPLPSTGFDYQPAPVQSGSAPAAGAVHPAAGAGDAPPA